MIVEDEELAADRLEMQIEKLGHEVFATVDNSEDALESIRDEQPDLILMDVNIEGEYDGIELADLIHEKYLIPVLFISSLEDERTFKRISRTNPVGFLIKPCSDIQLQRSIQLVVSQLEQSTPPEMEVSSEAGHEIEEFIFIKKRNSLIKVPIDDIFYLEADGRYCQIYTRDQKYLVRIPLKDMFSKLARDYFIQTHRSFVVNLKKIQSLDLEQDVILMENRTVPLSRREKDKVLKCLKWI